MICPLLDTNNYDSFVSVHIIYPRFHKFIPSILKLNDTGAMLALSASLPTAGIRKRTKRDLKDSSIDS